MGVWIEISKVLLLFQFDIVTPLVGVWIEIYNPPIPPQAHTVTPLVGVWIEIVFLSVMSPMSAGHSPCGSVD